MNTLGVPNDRPFTLHGAGVSRAVLRRLQLSGEVVRLVRGVYADASLSMTPDVRRQAVELAIPAGSAPSGLAAAWAHGLVEVCPHLESRPGAWPDLLTVAVESGSTLGLAAYDAALRQGLSHRALLEAVPLAERPIAALADGRALNAAESTVRQAWWSADLPSPRVGFVLRAAGLERRVALAHPPRLMAVTTTPWTAADLAIVESAGWRVTQIDPQRVTLQTIGLLSGHLRREFHRQLLAQVSA